MSKYVRKNITIKEEQADWIDKKGINLSKFVQRRIEEAMEKWR